MTYSIKEAAEKLTVSEITLRRIITNGEINYHKIGKIYRITDDDINLYIKSKTIAKKDNGIEVLSSGNISLADEIIKKIEKETVDMWHGIVRFSLHVVNGKPIRYTVSREQSVMWVKDDDKSDQSIDHANNGNEVERVEKE